MAKFYKTTFTIDVLSEEPFEGGHPLGDSVSLEQIAYEINEGSCVGTNLRSVQVELTPKEAADALIEAGSDPSFFSLDDQGNAVEI
jgi:hypothetical protein